MTSGLPWVRIDSDIASAPKVADMIAEHGQKGKAAAFVFVASIGYCAQHLTDGQLKRGALLFIHGTPQDARLLVEANLWEPNEKGWRVVNYENHQATRDAVEQRSEKNRQAANARWANA